MTYLEDDAEMAVQLFMAEYAVNRDEALRRIVRDWLIGNGYLPPNEDDASDQGPGGDAEELVGGA